MADTSYEVLKSVLTGGSLTTRNEATTEYEVLNTVYDETNSALRVNITNLSSATTYAAGNDTEIQFNDSGVVGASSNFTYNGTSLDVGGNVGITGTLDVTGETTVNELTIITGAVLSKLTFTGKDDKGIFYNNNNNVITDSGFIFNDTNHTLTVGESNIATGATHSFTVGESNVVTGTHNVAFGNTNTASGDYGCQVSGSYNIASGKNSTASGYGSTASGDYSRAHGCGVGSTASGVGSTASGYGSEASGDYSTASGYYSKSFGDYSFSCGNGSIAYSESTICLGANLSGVTANTTYIENLEIDNQSVSSFIVKDAYDGTRYKAFVSGGTWTVETV